MESRTMERRKLPLPTDRINSYLSYNHHYRARRTSLEITLEEETPSDGKSTFSNYTHRERFDNSRVTPESVYKSLLKKKTGGSVYSYSAASSARAKIKRSQNVPKPESLAEVPKDGNLSGLSCRDLCSVLSCVHFSPSIIARIKNHRISGKTFGKLTDGDLNDLGINNPIVQHFRNKSKRKHSVFML